MVTSYLMWQLQSQNKHGKFHNLAHVNDTICGPEVKSMKKTNTAVKKQQYIII